MRHVRKSTLYELSPYAFKFVNTIRIWHPREYFRPNFPFGHVPSEELYARDFQNDFQYAGSVVGEHEKRDPEEGAYAFVVRTKISLDGQYLDLVVLTHETGLEILLIGAGLFVGTEVSKYLLKRVLEKSESRINSWWKSKSAAYKDREAHQPLVDHLLIRTRYWEIALDGDFSPTERERIIELVARTSSPSETVDDFISTVESTGLQTKVLSHSRRIVRRRIHE